MFGGLKITVNKQSKTKRKDLKRLQGLISDFDEESLSNTLRKESQEAKYIAEELIHQKQRIIQ